MFSSIVLRRLSRAASVALFTALCMVLPACGTSDDPTILVPVSGTVTSDGTKVTSGRITFNPDSSKGNTSTKIPSGHIQPDGTYTIQTGTSQGTAKEGAPPGWYKITVTSTGGTSSEDMKDSKDTKHAKQQPQFNAKYAKPTAGIPVEVKEGGPMTFDIKLTK